MCVLSFGIRISQMQVVDGMMLLSNGKNIAVVHFDKPNMDKELGIVIVHPDKVEEDKVLPGIAK